MSEKWRPLQFGQRCLKAKHAHSGHESSGDFHRRLPREDDFAVQLQTCFKNALHDVLIVSLERCSNR